MSDIIPAEFFTDPGPSPHAATAELRAKCPVHRIDNPPGAQAYAVFGNKVIGEAFLDPRLSKQTENLPAQYREKAATSMLMERNLVFSDPPEHTRLRKPISRSFLPDKVAKLCPRIQDIADDLIDDFPETGEIDLLSTFALPLPLTTICEYLGIPVEDQPLFQHWSYIISQDPLRHAEGELKAASRDFANYFTTLVAQRRTEPRNNLLNDLISARDENVFTEKELISTLFLVIAGGHKTVANMLGNGMALLLRHPEQLAMLRTTPALIPSAVEEMLRYEGPAAWAAPRFAVEDMQLGGVPIPKGSFVHLSLAGAGHDPDVYDGPERFDITRSPNHHLSFGYGAHFCVGAPLARLQGEIAFCTLLRRLPDFELAVAPEELVWLADDSRSRGLESLPVRLRGRLPR